LKQNLLSENPQNIIKLRKLKEDEIVMLLRSLWSSIREELGLSSRNIFIAVITSSLILGSLLLFIFIGVSVFSPGNDPFASTINSLLTVGAGIGVNSNVQKGESPEGDSSSAHNIVVEKFCILLQTRLKNSYAIFIKILALASCKESDAAVVLQCIMQASSKFREQSEDPGDHSGNHSSDAGEDQLSNGESQAAGEQLSNGQSQAAGEYAVC